MLQRCHCDAFLLTWMGVPLSVGSIDRCIREVGVACEPVAEDLLEAVRAAGLILAVPQNSLGRDYLLLL